MVAARVRVMNFDADAGCEQRGWYEFLGGTGEVKVED